MKFLIRSGLLILLLLPCRSEPPAAKALTPDEAAAESAPITASSPDGAYFAAARRTPDDEIIWRREADHTRLVIFRLKKEIPDILYASHLIPSRLVTQWRWSPDSKFLVLTTKSTGGHRPYSFHSFVFCVADKSLRRMEGVTGMVLEGDFKIEAPDVAVMTVRDGDHDPLEPGGQKTMKIVLHEVVGKMAKVEMKP